MAAKAKLSLILVLILSVLVLYAGLGVAKQDPEQKQCRHQCRVQQQYSKEEKEECGRKCEDYHREKKACEDYHREKKEVAMSVMTIGAWVRAGTPIYLINRDENEKLYIVEFFRPVNLPGHYDVFFGAGGEGAESFYKTFSIEILEAALR
ncbi:hypothetical protein QUC31_004647, partial [Theobroma cacao]